MAKVAHYGVRQSAVICAQRVSDSYYEWYWRRAVARNTAHTTWATFVAMHDLSHNGTDFLQRLSTKLELHSADIVPAHLSDTELIACAHMLCTTIDVLGSGPIAYTQMPWHTDIRARASGAVTDYQFDSSSFYKDIRIPYGTDTTVRKDIKLPWEMSRAQHMVVIAYAYTLTHNTHYAQVCITQMLDWIEKNPFMRGVNWMCPMDVGLRAVNWVWTLQLLMQTSMLDHTTLQTIVASLHDHAVYLEYNWELYDGRTSNHYLSDLVGYYYLCYVFRSIPAYQTKAAWCWQQILRELDKQVFDDGTDYEGSTYYHRLVTELFYHAVLASRAFGFLVAEDTLKKIDRMSDFVKNCTPAHGRLIALGDHDSGAVLYWKHIKNLHQSTHIFSHDAVRQYDKFGVAIVAKDSIHMSFKEQVHTYRQPAGHMHNDALSCTLSYGNYELLVDPGSYVYTPSSVWRNYFRSYTAHSTFGIMGHEFVHLDQQIFSLAMPESRSTMQIHQEDAIISLYAYHDLYARFGVRMHRSILVDTQQATITFTDWCSKLAMNTDAFEQKEHVLLWNLTLAPECVVVSYDAGFGILIDGAGRAHVESDLLLYTHPGYVSRAYGSILATTYLRAQEKLSFDAKKITTIMLLPKKEYVYE